MEKLKKQVSIAQEQLRNQILENLKRAPISPEQYGRYLSMQYHLTKGVQTVFMRIAANECLGKRKSLRHWLLAFAEEEEFHYKIAANDLKALGMGVGEMPLDVKLWWLFFNDIIDTKPFVRLGATFILENISMKSSDLIHEMIKTSTFINDSNSKFLIIHQHGPNLDHGNQIFENVMKVSPTPQEMDDLLYGARVASLFFERFMNFVFKGETINP